MAGKEILRRFAIFMTGVLVCAVGIAFITRAGLGTSPISSIPFVLSLITPVSMGVYTLSFNLFFLLCESLLVDRFTVAQALQIPVTVLFSLCVDALLCLSESIWKSLRMSSCSPEKPSCGPWPGGPAGVSAA